MLLGEDGITVWAAHKLRQLTLDNAVACAMQENSLKDHV